MMEEYGTDRAWPFAEGGGATLAVATALWGGAVALWRERPAWPTRLLLLVASALWLLILYFFRDPNRPLSRESGMVVAPGDGRVVGIERERETVYLQQETIRISIFLSILDVHVQRVPIGGRIMLVDHRPGKFLQAFRPEASTENEHIAMVVATPYGRVLVKQIAGIMARRCVNYLAPGDIVQTGERFGLIRFGSRVDLFLPPEATLLVAEGELVRGGLTPMALLPGERKQSADDNARVDNVHSAAQ
ncbi:MAG: phosphatidylserine decarboxylase [Candidatus Promineifilaceae bacterium]|nr:phosphatidylserine decarboxylase [Candidatus Promineifilaceae bacterium]